MGLGPSFNNAVPFWHLGLAADQTGVVQMVETDVIFDTEIKRSFGVDVDLVAGTVTILRPGNYYIGANWGSAGMAQHWCYTRLYKGVVQVGDDAAIRADDDSMAGTYGNTHALDTGDILKMTWQQNSIASKDIVTAAVTDKHPVAQWFGMRIFRA